MAESSLSYEQVFEKRSGLVRSISLVGAAVMGIHCISLSSSGFIPFSWIASVWPGANIIGVLSLAAVCSLFIAFSYAAIGAMVPVDGADYVLTSRVFHPLIGFITSWALLIASGFVAGGLVAWIPKSALPALLQPMATIFHDPNFAQWASQCSSTTGSIAIGTICVVFVWASMLMDKNHLLKFMSFGLVLGILAWIIIYASFLWPSVPGPHAFQDAWNRVMGNSPFGSFEDRLRLAHMAGMTASTSTLQMTIAGLVMGYWVFYGYAIPTFFAGEVRKASKGKTLLIASSASIIVAWAIFSFGAFLLLKVRNVPTEWVAAEGYIANNPDRVLQAAGTHVDGFPWITFYAAILRPSFPLVLITAFSWVYTLINLVQTYFFYASRIIFAWSIDGVIPRFFSRVNPRTKNPVHCIWPIALLAEIGVLDAAKGGPLGAQMSFILFAVITQLVTVVALACFPYRRPDLFRLAPTFFGSRIGPFPLVTLSGLCSTVYLVWVIVAIAMNPDTVAISNLWITLGVFLVTASAGATIFLIAGRLRKAHHGIEPGGFNQNLPFQ